MILSEYGDAIFCFIVAFIAAVCAQDPFPALGWGISAFFVALGLWCIRQENARWRRDREYWARLSRSTPPYE